ncbi:hypothetical protein [Eleftheria terrae]|uniref:hypothetical protein n=1 Tax=Eleftheria terrae TaxID=1597781 RepID=UPI00263A52F6|nr:hypothetical protein [Eleftheria terrae]WKB51857.1 hypothetical protein N7L95_18920 [Eleftheria terrae]
MDLNHPLMQSVALPLLLALAGAGLLRHGDAARPARRAGAALGLSVLLASGWMLGWPLHPQGLTEKLPWLVAGALLAGLLLDAFRLSARVATLLGAVLWALALAWLRGASWPLAAAAWAAGSAVLAALAHTPAERASGPALLGPASLGVALLAFMLGSMLLFQLALLLACACAGLLPWLWPTPRVRFSAAAWLPASLAWLCTAWALLVLTPAKPGLLLPLLAGFAAERVLRHRRLPGRRALSEPLAVALLAALCAGGALLMATLGPAGAPAAGEDEPYYQPRW